MGPAPTRHCLTTLRRPRLTRLSRCKLIRGRALPSSACHARLSAQDTHHARLQIALLAAHRQTTLPAACGGSVVTAATATTDTIPSRHPSPPGAAAGRDHCCRMTDGWRARAKAHAHLNAEVKHSMVTAPAEALELRDRDPTKAGASRGRRLHLGDRRCSVQVGRTCPLARGRHARGSRVRWLRVRRCSHARGCSGV